MGRVPRQDDLYERLGRIAVSIHANPDAVAFSDIPQHFGNICALAKRDPEKAINALAASGIESRLGGPNNGSSDR